LGQILTAAELRAAGIDAYLVKPVKQSRLFDCLVNVMGKAAAESTFVRSNTPAVIAPDDATQRVRLHILLVEDNSINQKVALGQLQKLGYTADAVGNGLEALEALNQIPYDIIFMDCQMPEMDGYEASREIRRVERVEGGRCRWKTPVYIIAMTANAMQGDREKCLAAGMTDYVSKPVKATELQAALDRAKQSLADREEKAGSPHPLQKAPSEATESDKALGTEKDSPVDVERLIDISDGDPEQIRELIRLYRTQANEVIQKMETAIRLGSAKELELLAHKGLGISANCGMMAVVESFTKLQAMARTGELQEAEQLHVEAVKQLRRIERFLAEYVKSL
jgi:CheY-like chemotaxis protein/HPt (histidine-containing phosphotransfer) domain-containing protein